MTWRTKQMEIKWSLHECEVILTICHLFHSCSKQLDKYITFALKTVSESTVSMDLAPSGITRWRRQTIETYWPRFSESPTNIRRLPRSISSIRVALKLQFTTIQINLCSDNWLLHKIEQIQAIPIATDLHVVFFFFFKF